jgi:hypothetical protein
LNDNFLGDRKEKFDGILLRYVDSHISDFDRVLRVVREHLNHGGRLWIFTGELDYMHCHPPHDAFDLYKRATEHMYQTFGIDGHRGLTLPQMLGSEGYHVKAIEWDPMSNEDLGTEMYQRLMLHEARFIRDYDPQALSQDDLEKIGRFVEEVVPLPEYYGTYGVVMMASCNP